MSAASRIVANTGFQFGRLVLTVGMALLTTRWTLDALGVEDFGLFNLVVGVVALLSFVSVSLATSAQRAFAVDLGRGDQENLRRTFRASVWIHNIVGIGVGILIELGGLVLFDNYLNISPDRMTAAWIIFHLTAFTAVISITAVPYDALIGAHERLHVEAIASVVDSAFRLAISGWLLQVTSDRLIVFSAWIFVIALALRVFKTVYCLNTFPEAEFDLIGKSDPMITKRLMSFAGWNTFGALCFVIRSQGLGVVLNNYFGTSINASYGIANQVNSQIGFASVALVRSISPQLMKSEGEGDRGRALRLASLASRGSTLLMVIFAVPAYFEMDFLLRLWLGHPPPLSVEFCRLILISTLITQITVGIQITVQAIGKIAAYQMVMGSLLVLTMPLGVILLLMGYPPTSVLVGVVCIDGGAAVFRMVFLKKLGGFGIRTYLADVVFRAAIPFGAACAAALAIQNFMNSGFHRLILVSVGSGLTAILLGMTVGVLPSERARLFAITEKIRAVILKIRG